MCAELAVCGLPCVGASRGLARVVAPDAGGGGPLSPDRRALRAHTSAQAPVHGAGYLCVRHTSSGAPTNGAGARRGNTWHVTYTVTANLHHPNGDGAIAQLAAAVRSRPMAVL